MSQRSERIAEVIEDLEDPLERVSEVYHVPVLAALLAFMVWVRARNWGNFVVDGRVLFSGNDAWYHLRMVQYTVKQWPATMPFDPWTHFPVGTSVGQFGTLYDQLIATAALVVGLGSPTANQIAMTHLFAPVVFGTLAAVPTYFLGKRLGGRFGALVGVLLLALTPGQFLSRSLVGFSDHHIAEVLFMATGVLAVAIAVTVAQRERPVYELVVTREWHALRRPIEWATLAGVVVGLYIWVWPPGVFLVGILGIFFAVTLAAHHARGISPDHVAIAGVTTNVVIGLLALIPLTSLGFGATRFSLAQPLVAFTVAGGCAFMAAFSRLWDDRNLPRSYYPVAIAGIGLLVVLAARLALPETFGFFRTQFLRVFGLGASATAQTVAEAQPPQGAVSFLRRSYGLAFFTGILGFSVLVARVALDDEPSAEHLLVLVWSVFVTLAALTQLRFDYYLAIAVAVLNATLVGWVLGLVGLDEVGDPLDIDVYQVMAVAAVLLVVVTPLVVTQSGAIPALAVSDQAQPGEVTFWTESLDWVDQNTPAVGAYGDGTPSDLKYYGTYERQDDFRYEDGEYGVLAWWDYGHWITVLGHRIPFANPFQQHAREAANFLLAPNETNATPILTSEDGEQTRYVMVDYQLGLAGTQKFLAPSVWETEHNVSRLDLAIPVRNRTTGRPEFSVRRQRSYESMRTRLYVFHGSRTTPQIRRGQVIVVDYEVQTVKMPDGRRRSVAFMPKPGEGRLIRRFNSTAEARAFIQNDDPWPSQTRPKSLAGEPTSQIGGVGGIPSEPVPALEHYRLVHAGTPIQRGPLGTPYPWVKTFERVPGASIEGTGPPNTTVTATVRLNMTNVGRTFSYRQRVETGPDGEFAMTVPYATEGYENWGPSEGYTNTSVRAQGPYRLQTPLVENETGGRVQYAATVNVSEAHVVGENQSTIRANLQKGLTLPPPGQGDGNQSTGNETGNRTGNETDNTSATNGSNNTTGSTNTSGSNTSSSSLQPPSSAWYGGPRAAPRS